MISRLTVEADARDSESACCEPNGPQPQSCSMRARTGDGGLQGSEVCKRERSSSTSASLLPSNHNDCSDVVGDGARSDDMNRQSAAETRCLCEMCDTSDRSKRSDATSVLWRMRLCIVFFSATSGGGLPGGGTLLRRRSSSRLNSNLATSIDVGARQPTWRAALPNVPTFPARLAGTGRRSAAGCCVFPDEVVVGGGGRGRRLATLRLFGITWPFSVDAVRCATLVELSHPSRSAGVLGTSPVLLCTTVLECKLCSEGSRRRGALEARRGVPKRDLSVRVPRLLRLFCLVALRGLWLPLPCILVLAVRWCGCRT